MRHIFILFLACGLCGAASAQSNDSRTSDEEERFSVGGNIGFMRDPNAFLMSFEANYDLGSGFSVGPLLHLGFDDDFTLVAPVVYGRYGVDLKQFELPREIQPLVPYGQLGMGLVHVDIDIPSRLEGLGIDDDQTEFLINFGFGFEYPVADRISLGTRVLFNFVPDEFFDESAYYTWEVLGVQYRF